jgi:hypothetical protein
MCHTYVVIYENTLQEIRRNPHEFVSEVRANSHIAWRTHTVPLPCRAAKGLDCVFSISFTQ